MPGRLASTSELTDDQVSLSEIEAVSLFGLRPTWKDGHSTGIYGLALLRSLCPCADCGPARPGRPGPG